MDDFFMLLCIVILSMASGFAFALAVVDYQDYVYDKQSRDAKSRFKKVN